MPITCPHPHQGYPPPFLFLTDPLARPERAQDPDIDQPRQVHPRPQACYRWILHRKRRSNLVVIMFLRPLKLLPEEQYNFFNIPGRGHAQHDARRFPAHFHVSTILNVKVNEWLVLNQTCLERTCNTSMISPSNTAPCFERSASSLSRTMILTLLSYSLITRFTKHAAAANDTRIRCRVQG